VKVATKILRFLLKKVRKKIKILRKEQISGASTRGQKKKKKCSMGDCQELVSERMSHVVIMIGERRFSYCSTIHFLNDADVKLIGKDLESAAKLFVEYRSNSQCQGCSNKTVDSNLRLSTARKVQVISKTPTTYRPYFFCTIECMLKFIKVKNGKEKWNTVMKHMQHTEEIALPKIIRKPL